MHAQHSCLERTHTVALQLVPVLTPKGLFPKTTDSATHPQRKSQSTAYIQDIGQDA